METDTATDVLAPAGSALGDFLYPKPAARNAGAIVRWWEARRIPFNLIVGGTGLVSLGAINLIVALPPGGQWIGIPWIGIMLYGALANVCYSLGPATELALQKIWGKRLLPSGPMLFRMGLTFAVGLTLFPVLVATFVFVLRVLGIVP